MSVCVRCYPRQVRDHILGQWLLSRNRVIKCNIDDSLFGNPRAGETTTVEIGQHNNNAEWEFSWCL